eukprot:CAMPEP_0178390174 /NCGR_PEP_ID=MMETSP0689_2-20121128/10508_1 /TAXON_ID=160604 /ORGANISM="Amphidinium massartii, Strain CS-259" /LENGTH=260 /DNA_ID=CAMNT_0020010671 /DNA_START=22 /DNA_END=805 /DNA_ORIENTATION=-
MAWIQGGGGDGVRNAMCGRHDLALPFHKAATLRFGVAGDGLRRHFCASGAEAESPSTTDTAERLSRLATALGKDPALAEKLAEELEVQPALKTVLEVGERLSPDQCEAEVTPPTRVQLRNYCLNNAVPFIGFGVLDNGVMLIAGDLIDAKLGAALGISTLAAAAVGNTCSNVCGLWASGLIETFEKSLGIPPHGLTAAQQELLQVRIAKNTAMIVGIVIGCTIGMFPLAYPEDWRLWESRTASSAASWLQELDGMPEDGD